METTNLNPIIINVNALRAAALCVADKKDPRYYLHGVYVKIKQGRAENQPRAVVAGTNGSILFVGLSEIEPADASPSIDAWFEQSLIIPIDAIKALDKKAKTVHLSQVTDGAYRLGNTVFTCIYGQYPDIGRVIPDSILLDSKTQTPANYHPDYLTRANKALQAYYGSKPTTVYELAQYGTDAGIMHAGENRAQVVIMPLRPNGKQGTALSTPAFNRDYL